jgi:hypothetical protein
MDGFAFNLRSLGKRKYPSLNSSGSGFPMPSKNGPPFGALNGGRIPISSTWIDIFSPAEIPEMLIGPFTRLNCSVSIITDSPS